MSLMTRVGLLAGAAALTLTGVSNARPALDAANDQAQRIAALEAEVAALRSANNQTWLTEQRSAEIRGLVQDVLADADTRASLLQAGATAGYDRGFVVGSTDGNWLLRTNFLMQQRFVFNWHDDGAGPDGDTTRWGFENTRSKLILSGHVVNPDWFFQFDHNFASNGNEREGTLNAFLGHDYGNGLKVKVGSMKLPILREELVDAQYQLAVERSLVNYAFTGGYADGLQLHWQGDNFQFMGMLSDGVSTGQTSWAAYDTEYALTGRAEFLLGGNWNQFRDFTSRAGEEPGVLLGAAIHHEKGESGTAVSEGELLILTGDASVEFGGANIYGALVWTDFDIPGGADFNPWGFVLQGGFNLSDAFELFARFEWIDADTPTVDDIEIITGGVNFYFSGHNAKWTTDVGYGLNSVGGPHTLTGWRSDTSDGQVVIRTQWQLLF